MEVDGSASFIEFQLFHFPTRIIPEHGVFWRLLIRKVNLGCIWFELSRNLLNVNHLVKEMRNIDRRCKATLFLYNSQVQLNDR